MFVDDESRVSKLPGYREREWTLKVDVENSRLGVGSVHGTRMPGTSNLSGSAVDASARNGRAEDLGRVAGYVRKRADFVDTHVASTVDQFASLRRRKSRDMRGGPHIVEAHAASVTSFGHTGELLADLLSQLLEHSQ